MPYLFFIKLQTHIQATIIYHIKDLEVLKKSIGVLVSYSWMRQYVLPSAISPSPINTIVYECAFPFIWRQKRKEKTTPASLTNHRILDSSALSNWWLLSYSGLISRVLCTVLLLWIYFLSAACFWCCFQFPVIRKLKMPTMHSWPVCSLRKPN
jgi:hypothetical protein